MLFKTITEIKEFLPIGVGNDFDRLKPHIANAENKYIKPLLGTPMYDELQEFYEAEYPVEPNDAQIATKELLGKVQHATIHLAYFIGFDFLNASISDAGFQRVESERSKGLYKYQEDNLREYFSDSGFNTLDDVLVFMESNIAYFNEFKLHENYTVLKQSFLPTLAEVEKIPYNLFGSRLIFLALKPHFAYAEDTDIKPILGETIYNTVKTEMVKDAPSAAVLALLPYIRKPLIYLAAALLMEETGGILGDKGLYFRKTNATYPGNKIKGPSTEEVVARRVGNERMKAAGYLEALKAELIEKWEEYNGQIGRIPNRDNTDKKTFWA
ncbi:hypothetical protein OU798_07380 [Prolixibacteraceae bacterium Z1-6]|uniref:Uncharacterized protein n=1 Tax=Draconibacterium aestuarii TaxID=2998507 RepID=A0A9X3FCN4_9BACT|nr:hypothetical protein [Prolixibacteraceae bacterium Z1-6]